jgi:hypothetical protein
VSCFPQKATGQTGFRDGLAGDSGGSAGQIIRAFDAAGTSAPVKLDRSAKRRLLTVCEDWLDEMNIDGLPEGIFDLRNALFDERAYGQLDE